MKARKPVSHVVVLAMFAVAAPGFSLGQPPVQEPSTPGIAAFTVQASASPAYLGGAADTIVVVPHPPDTPIVGAPPPGGGKKPNSL